MDNYKGIFELKLRVLCVLATLREGLLEKADSKMGKKWYSKGMDLEFKESAFRHNKSEADIRCAFRRNLWKQ